VEIVAQWSNDTLGQTNERIDNLLSAGMSAMRSQDGPNCFVDGLTHPAQQLRTNGGAFGQTSGKKVP
jgi:hypothetical protein